MIVAMWRMSMFDQPGETVMNVQTPLLGSCVLCCAIVQIASIEPLTSCHAFESGETIAQSEESASVLDRRLEMVEGLAPGAFDPTDGVSCIEGEMFALFFNADLRIERMEADVAMSSPETNWIGDGQGLEFDSTSLLTIPVSLRPEGSEHSQDATREMRMRRLVDSEWRTRNLLRRRWTEWSAAIANRELVGDLIRQLEEIEDIANKLRNMQELNRTEHRLLRIELANRRSQAAEAELQVIRTRADLLQAMGLPSEVGDLLMPGFPSVDMPTFDDIAARLIEHNTTIAMQLAAWRNAASGRRRDIDRTIVQTTLERLTNAYMAQRQIFDLATDRLADYRRAVEPLLSGQQKDIKRIAEMGELDMMILLKTATRAIDAEQTLLELQTRRMEAIITIREILGPDLDGPPRSTPVGANKDDSDNPDTGSSVFGDAQ